MTSDSAASARVWSGLSPSARQALERELAPSDLQTLLLGVAEARAGQVDPPRLMRRWRDDRFVQPARTDPRRLHAVEGELWRLLPTEFAAVELSPVTPLGTCTAVGAAAQNRIVSTVRQTEVVSDPTNVLALAAARRRSGADEVHLAASHRVLRAQQFPDGYSAHFRLFALVSSGRGAGGVTTELRFFRLHLRFWLAVLESVLGVRGGQAAYTALDPVPDEQWSTIAENDRDPEAYVADPNRTRGLGYYRTAMLQLRTRSGAELGDGGFTDWTAQLLADRKERCLISCISVERLADVIGVDSTR